MPQSNLASVELTSPWPSEFNDISHSASPSPTFTIFGTTPWLTQSLTSSLPPCCTTRRRFPPGQGRIWSSASTTASRRSPWRSRIFATIVRPTSPMEDLGSLVWFQEAPKQEDSRFSHFFLSCVGVAMFSSLYALLHFFHLFFYFL